MSSLVRVHELAKQYDSPNGVLAVDGVSFDIHEGEIFGLLGPNGAGKTTTISMLSCLLKPTGGDATVDGHSIAREPMEVKKVIGAGPGRDCFCLFVGHCQFGAFVRHAGAHGGAGGQHHGRRGDGHGRAGWRLVAHRHHTKVHADSGSPFPLGLGDGRFPGYHPSGRNDWRGVAPCGHPAGLRRPLFRAGRVAAQVRVMARVFD